jgi:hypothetical protein
MTKNYKDPNFFTNAEVFDGNVKKHFQWITALKTMGTKAYWNIPNTVEFLAFTTKAVIIIPGLLFGVSIWWLYIFALISSVALVWTSTVKTLPSIILFNILWIILASTAILNNFFGFLPK